MNRRIFQNSAFLIALYYAQPLQRKFMIEFISPDQMWAISDIAIKILQGCVYTDKNFDTTREQLDF